MKGLRFDLARVTIEFTSPFRVSGQEHRGSPWDAAFFVDVHGVPLLPATSLVGVLRHACAAFLGEPADSGPRVTALFGFQRGTDGQDSRVSASFGQAVGRDGVASGLPVGPGASEEPDPVLALLREGVLRDHVALSHRGVADDRKKFDELLVPAGARFVFDLRVDGDGDDLDTLLDLLAGPATRLGGATRRGLGEFKVVGVRRRRFDLAKAEDRAAARAVLGDLADVVAVSVLPDVPLPGTESGRWVTLDLHLRAEDYWMLGGGHPHRDDHRAKKRKAERGGERKVRTEDAWVDRVPVSEQQIVWEEQGGREVPRVLAAKDSPYLLAGSSIKGALRHRAAFHHRRATGQVVELRDDLLSAVPASLKESAVRLAATDPMDALFGSVKARVDGEGARGQAGLVFIEDVRVSNAKVGRLDHVSLDRFTMGPMDGLLFSEAPLYGGEVRVRIRIADRDDTPRQARQALKAALDDLCAGRLALGAHASRGLGCFRGPAELPWSDGGRWIAGGDA